MKYKTREKDTPGECKPYQIHSTSIVPDCQGKIPAILCIFNRTAFNIPPQTAIATAMFCAFFPLDFGNLHLLPPPRVPPFPTPSTALVLWIHLTSCDKSCFNHASQNRSACPQNLPRYSHVPSHHIPAMATEYVSVQLLGFDLFCSLTHIFSLHDFCSSGQ